MRKFLYAILILTLICSCSKNAFINKTQGENPRRPGRPEEAQLVVGFSQMNHINPWRVAETNDLKREAGERDVKLIITDAESSKEKQISDIAYLVSQGVDYIICAPLLYAGYEEAFTICREAKVPLIMLDREVEGTAGEDFLTFVGSDFVKEGEMAAKWLEEASGGSARIIELQGREGASCVIDRHYGFTKAIDDAEGMKIIHSAYADHERIKGQQVMEEIILSFGRNFDAVYAQNDEMAIGAIQALKAADIEPGKDVLVISIDGSRDALKSIIAGELGATVECSPKLAKLVFHAIYRHKMGKSVPEKIIVEDRLFDKSNALEQIDEAF